MIRNVIFDVDGTLWDSAEAVATAWNHVLKEKYREEVRRVLTAEDMYRNMGKTMTAIGQNLFPDLPAAMQGQVMQDMTDYENAYLQQHAGRFYPGLVQTLRTLRSLGYHLYIVSNCQDGYIQALLSHLENDKDEPEDADRKTGAAFYFDDFECFGRTGLPKDGSIGVLMERNYLLPEQTVYVGDTNMDEASARKAGIQFIHAAYGFGKAIRPDGVIHDISELPACLHKLDEGYSCLSR